MTCSQQEKPPVSEQFVLLELSYQTYTFFFPCGKDSTKSNPRFLCNIADRNLFSSEMNEEVVMIFNNITVRRVWCLCQETSPSTFTQGEKKPQPTALGHQSDRNNEAF